MNLTKVYMKIIDDQLIVYNKVNPKYTLLFYFIYKLGTK